MADAAALFRRATEHHKLKQLQEANRLYFRVLEIDQDNVDCWHLLGMICYESGKPGAAIPMIERALALRPDFIEARNNLGNAYCAAGFYQQGVEHYREALGRNPDLAHIWYNLGNALRALGRYDEAMEPYRCAIALQPRNAAACFHLSCVAQAARQFEEAEIAARQGLAFEDYSVVLWLALGRALIGQDRQVEAAEALERALSLQPDSIEALLETAGTFERWRMPDKSAMFYKLVLDREPENKLALPRYIDMKLSLCDWSDYDAFCAMLIGRIEQEIASGQPISTDVFNLHALPVSQDFTFRMAQHKARQMAQEARAAKARCGFSFTRKPGRRIRLGYLLPYTTKQSMPLVLQQVIAKHDRDRFEVFGYSLMACDGVPFSRAFRKDFDAFADLVKVNPEIAAQRIYADGIDLLIDTTGHTSVHWLDVLALQPAPVQAHYLGYSLTTGSDFVQYLITDRQFIPPEWQRYCTEQLVYLPDSFMATLRAEIAGDPVERADFDLPEHGMVFANFNHPCKFEPGIFDIWMRILRQVPGSVLWLGDWMHATRGNLKREAQARGIDPSRLVFAKLQDHPKHLARLRLADLALDNRFHGGGVTTVDALWAGLPVLTVAGNSPAARLGATLTSAANVPEMICADFAAYEARAVEFGSNRPLLQAIRDKLWNNRLTCPLFDNDRYRRHLEAGYEMMWQNYCAGNPPRRIEVPPLA